MAPQHDIEEIDGVDIAPVPLDRETRKRLVRLAAETGKPPLDLAAQLLRDMLEDDDRENGPGRPVHGVLM